MTGHPAAPPRRRPTSRLRSPSARWAHCGVWGRPRDTRSIPSHRRRRPRVRPREAELYEVATSRAKRPSGRPRVWGRRLWQLLALAAAVATLLVVPPGTERRVIAFAGYLAAVLWLELGTRSMPRRRKR